MTKAAAVILSLAVFGGILPALLLAQFSVWNLTAPALAVASIMIFSAWRLGVLAGEPVPRPLQITFYIFTYIWLGLTPFLQVSTGRFPWLAVHSSDDLLAAAGVVWCGVIAYEAALSISRRRQPKLAPISKTSEVVPILKLAFALLLASATVAAVLAATGLWQILFSPRQTDRGIDSVMGLNLAFAFLRIPIAFVAILAGCILRSGALTRRTRTASKVVFFISALLALVVSNPISAPRLMFGSVALGLVLACLHWRRWTNLFLVFGLTIGLLVAFPSMDMFRTSLNVSISDPMASYVSKGDFDAFQMVANTVAFCHLNGHTYGQQFLGALFFWFPRAFWPTKAHGTGVLVGRGVGYHFLNLSSPLWSEAFVDFGIIGTLCFLFLYGMITAKVEKAYISCIQNGWFNLVRVAVAFWAGYQLFFLRGDLQNGLAFCSCFALCLFMARMALTKKADDAGRQWNAQAAALRNFS